MFADSKVLRQSTTKIARRFKRDSRRILGRTRKACMKNRQLNFKEYFPISVSAVLPYKKTFPYMKCLGAMSFI